MWKIILALVLLAASFLGGLYTGKGQVETVTITEKGKVVEKIVDHVVTVTKVIHPDGTVQEKTETADHTADTQQQHTNTNTDVKPMLANYSLGIRYWADYSSLLQDVSSFQPKQVEVSVGRRLIANLWLEAGVRINSAALGLRVEF